MIRTKRAFTLTEMIVVIALIALLVALVLVSLRSVRQAAKSTDSLNSLRQLSLAYKSYMEDHNYRLLPGYLNKATLDYFDALQSPITAHLPNGTVLDQCNPASGRCDRSSYVWRLAPYMGDNWQDLFTDIRDPGLMARLSQEFDSGVYGPGSSTSAADIGISDHPSFGLNSIFIGGDSFHGGPDVVPLNPWSGPTYSNPSSIAATRFTQVKNPSKIILFAPTAPAGTGADLTIAYDNPDIGYAELRPPFTILDSAALSGQGQWINCQWILGTDGKVERRMTGDYGGGAGLPIARNGRDRLPVSHLDGSASIEVLDEIANDMSRWSPTEVISRAVNPNG